MGSKSISGAKNPILAKNEYILNPPGAKRDYNGNEIVLRKRYSQGWLVMASYIWKKSTGLIGTDWFDNWALSRTTIIPTLTSTRSVSCLSAGATNSSSRVW